MLLGTRIKDNGLSVELSGHERVDEKIVASWPDGSQHEIPLTVREFIDMSVCKGGGVVADLWAMGSEVTSHRIAIRQRVDRDLLVSVYEQEKQVLMIKETPAPQHNYGLTSAAPPLRNYI